MSLTDPSQETPSARVSDSRDRRVARRYWTLGLAVTFSCVAGAAVTRTGAQAEASTRQAFTPAFVMETARRGVCSTLFAPSARGILAAPATHLRPISRYSLQRRSGRLAQRAGAVSPRTVARRVSLQVAGQSVRRGGPDCPGNHWQAADVLARTAGRPGPGQSGAAAIRVPGTHPPQLAVGVGRVPGVPGRVLFSCDRTRRRLWTVRARPGAAYRASDGRGVSCVHALLDRAAEGERSRASSSTRCSTAHRRRAPTASR